MHRKKARCNCSAPSVHETVLIETAVYGNAGRVHVPCYPIYPCKYSFLYFLDDDGAAEAAAYAQGGKAILDIGPALQFIA